MRIAGGGWRGRTLRVPTGDAVRPTQDRVREALFNIIQFEVPGCDFLDLFAGSGAVGIEALSRGAVSVTFVEQNRRHVAVLEGRIVVQDGIFAGHAYCVYAYGPSAGPWLLVGCLAARNAKRRCQQSDGRRACELIYRGWNLVHLGCI